MGPVFELFPLEVGESVGLGEVADAGTAVLVEVLEEVLEEPMSTPGGISGVSTKYKFGAVHEKRSG